jgi:hypothetical protein
MDRKSMRLPDLATLEEEEEEERGQREELGRRWRSGSSAAAWSGSGRLSRAPLDHAGYATRGVGPVPWAARFRLVSSPCHMGLGQAARHMSGPG